MEQFRDHPVEVDSYSPIPNHRRILKGNSYAQKSTSVSVALIENNPGDYAVTPSRVSTNGSTHHQHRRSVITGAHDGRA